MFHTQKPTVMIFMMPGCPYCTDFKVVYDDMARDKRFRDLAVWKLYDRSKPQDQHVIQNYNIKSYPTILIHNPIDQKISKYNGRRSKESIFEYLSNMSIGFSQTKPTVMIFLALDKDHPCPHCVRFDEEYQKNIRTAPQYRTAIWNTFDSAHDIDKFERFNIRQVPTILIYSPTKERVYKFSGIHKSEQIFSAIKSIG